VLFEGVQYAWDRYNYTQNLSLLWQIDDCSAKDLGSATGYSELVLCLGSPKMKEVKAVLPEFLFVGYYYYHFVKNVKIHIG
jgi:hypothetical protein